MKSTRYCTISNEASSVLQADKAPEAKFLKVTYPA